MTKKTCAWCHKPTTLPETFAADTPILEWFEKRIENFCNEHNINKNKIWGENASWDSIQIPEKFEAELLIYDELLVTVSRKRICKTCLVDDQKLWNKYYDNSDLGDFDITIDDLK